MNELDDTIHVVLSSDDNYARYLAVTIVSVLVNRAEGDTLAFHVLDGGIQQGNRGRIEELVSSYGASIKFISIDQTLFSGKVLNITEKNHVTLATYYRLLIPSLINADRCIYMDCDMICRASLASIWRTEFGRGIAAAVRDIDDEKQSDRLGLSNYFNAGFFLFDLAAMRKESMQEQFFCFIEEHHDLILMHDQDVMNSVLHGRICELDKTWNCQVCKTHSCKQKGFYTLSKTANILHYIGRKKPWTKGCRAPGREQYWKYLDMTPWKRSPVEKILFQIKDFMCFMLGIFK